MFKLQVQVAACSAVQSHHSDSLKTGRKVNLHARRIALKTTRHGHADGNQRPGDLAQFAARQTRKKAKKCRPPVDEAIDRSSCAFIKHGRMRVPLGLQPLQVLSGFACSSTLHSQVGTQKISEPAIGIIIISLCGLLVFTSGDRTADGAVHNPMNK